MGQLGRVWFIMLKDLKIFFRDRMALFFFVVFPFLFVVVFSFVLSDVGGEDERLVLHVATAEAEGGLSYQILEAIATPEDAELPPGDARIVWDRDYEDARQQVESGNLSGFLTFPVDFTAGVFGGSGTELDVVADSEAFNTRAALGGLASSIATRIGSQRVAAQAAIEMRIEAGLLDPGDQEAIDAIVGQLIAGGGFAGAGSFIEFDTESVGEVEPENAANFVIPGYLVMFVFFSAALAAEMIVRERQNHTLERLLASSVRRPAILGGAFSSTAAKGLIQIAIFWTVGILAFKMDLGLSPWAVILLSVLMVIMSAAFAIMLASLVKTQRSAGSLAVLVALVLAPLGGCWWPLFVTPEWMQFLAKFTPHGWATTGFNKLLVFGAEGSDVITEMLVLLGFAVVFGIIGVWRFRTAAA